MVSRRLLSFLCLAAALCGSVPSAKADVYPVIIIGKVTMPDGSPPPVILSIERQCEGDYMGTAPGPLTNKKGEWVWRLEIDLYVQRSCVFVAHHDGYTSSRIDASNINESYLDKTVHVPDIVVYKMTADPYALAMPDGELGGRAKKAWDDGMKAIDQKKIDEAIADLQQATEASPRSGFAWHSLGVVNDKFGRKQAAKEAYQKAIEVDPKMIQPYATLSRVCIQLRDWQCVETTAEEGIKVDKKRVYPDLYLHDAVAHFEMKDLDGAEKDADELIALDKKHNVPRIEYVMGRILEEKGDLNGARDHMMKYLALDGHSKDAAKVQAHMAALGKPEAKDNIPPLEDL